MNFSKIGRYLLIPFAVFVSFVPIFDPLNVFSSLRNTAFDLFQNISPRESISSDAVIVLDIDEKSLSQIGRFGTRLQMYGLLLQRKKELNMLGRY